jgi:ribosome-associated protein
MANMIRVTADLSIGPAEIEWRFVRAAGPGGQNVNKVATAAQLRFDAAHSPSLPPDVRRRLLALAGQRATADGVIVIQARRFRTQARNRAAALGQLLDLLRRASVAPKRRRQTSAPSWVERERLQSKRRNSERKGSRRQVSVDE